MSYHTYSNILYVCDRRPTHMIREASVSQWKNSLLQESGYLMDWNQLTSLYLHHSDPIEKLLCNTVAEWDGARVNGFML